ncbi:hypothetical protein EH165_14905 [Nakamurella antarctica]|uniref:Uncharacterized protein n=1 Tax=Nakamurella antarctica TaxID=1902245 RepID=A0A3G8ZYY5_9ACTN|nr:hypothetical protein [Nakamurella antarctica]AZI59236.1 hypothetical protein EH165_14905 [Nakamurella antarctica]
MGTRRRVAAMRSDAALLARADWMDLLVAVAAGEVVRGVGGDTSFTAPHFWRGVVVTSVVRFLADQDLVRMPISGPAVLESRGQLLATLYSGSPSPWEHGLTWKETL